MELKVYQDAASTFAVYPRHNAQMYVLTGLASEAGEVMGKVAKALRGDFETDNCFTDDKWLADVAKELGDCLWFVAMACEELGLDLNDVALANLQKLMARKQANTIKGNGDNR